MIDLVKGAGDAVKVAVRGAKGEERTFFLLCKLLGKGVIVGSSRCSKVTLIFCSFFRRCLIRVRVKKGRGEAEVSQGNQGLGSRGGT